MTASEGGSGTAKPGDRAGIDLRTRLNAQDQALGLLLAKIDGIAGQLHDLAVQVSVVEALLVARAQDPEIQFVQEIIREARRLSGTAPAATR